MCNDFECIHQQLGICYFDDEECEGESCINCSTEYGEDRER